MIRKQDFISSIAYGLLTNKEFLSFVCENYPLELYKNELSIYLPLYEAVYDIYGKKKDLPTKQEVRNFLTFYYSGNENYVQDEKRALLLFLDDVSLEDNLSFEVALDIFKKFLACIKVSAHISSIRNNLDNLQTLSQITDNLNKEIISIANANTLSDYKLTKEKFESSIGIKKPIKLGYSLFDHYTDGFVVPEVNLLVAPSGVGKTLTAVNCVVDSAEYCLDHNIDELSVIVSYETPKEELHLRALACASRIPRERIISFKERLDIPQNLFGKEYEFNYLKYGLIKEGESEYQRYEKSYEIIDKIAFLDFTGVDGKGFGGIKEISSVLKELIKKENKKLRVVVIDWLGLLMERYLDSSLIDKKDSNTKTNALRYSIDTIRQKISIEFDCPVWVNHQLSGEATGRPPNKDFHISDAAECKSLHIFADFALVMGTLFKTPNYCARIFCEKARRTSPKESAVCTILGEISRCFIDNNLIFMSDIGKVVDRNTLKKLNKESSFTIYDDSN